MPTGDGTTAAPVGSSEPLYQEFARLDDPHYVLILNYFYFLLLDEGLAINASFRAIKAIQKKLKNLEPENLQTVLIAESSQIFHRYQKRHSTLKSSAPPPKSDWKTPQRDSLGAWKEYMRHATDESPEMMVLFYILKFPIQVIAEGLGLPEGTVYFRLGRGLESFSQGNHLHLAVKR